MSTAKTGIDIVEVSRFSLYKKDKEHVFLKKVFYEKELVYAFSLASPEVHLAGMFAAKEAVSKALGVALFPFAYIEIKHTKEGKPEAYFKNKKLKVSISIAHTKTTAVAVAIG